MRVIGYAKRNVCVRQQPENAWRVPAGVAEFESVAPPLVQHLQEGCEPLAIRFKMRRELKEDWTKLGMKVNYRPLDFPALVERIDHTFEWDAILIGFSYSAAMRLVVLFDPSAALPSVVCEPP